MLWTLAVPAGNTRGPRYMAGALAALREGSGRRGVCEFLIAPHGEEVGLGCRMPEKRARQARSLLLAAYPDLRIDVEPQQPRASKGDCWWTRLRLSPTIAALVREADLIDHYERQFIDPLAALLACMVPGKTSAVRPVVSIVARKAGWFATRLARLQARQRGVPEKQTGPLWLVNVRLAAFGSTHRKAAAIHKLLELAAAFIPFLPQQGGKLELGRVRHGTLPGRISWWGSWRLTSAELALLWHLPTEGVRTPQLHVNAWRELEPPPRERLPSPARHADVAVLGRTAFRERRELFGILPDDRLRGIYVLGASGTGKTTLLANLMRADIAAGRGVVCIDPHGDLVEGLRRTLPSHRKNDLLYFDPAGERVMSFNPLAHDDPRQRPLVASAVIETFRRLFADSWGPRLEHVLRCSLLSILEMPAATLIALHRLLVDEAYRKLVIGRISDDVVRSFWLNEWANWKPQFRAEVLSPVLNKLSAFTTNPLLRRVLDAPQSKLRLRQVLDRRKVLLCNVSKGRLGHDASQLLGSLLVAGVELAAMSRAELSPEQRTLAAIYIDEVQNFAGSRTLATAWSEGRKFGTSWTVAHQFLDQLDEVTLAAAFGNVGTLISFRCGQDAERLAEQFGGDLLPEDLRNLPKHHAYARLLVDSTPTRPFSMGTLPPLRGN